MSESDTAHINYHSIYNTSILPIWIEDMSDLHSCFSALRETGVENLEEYLSQNPAAIQELASKIRVLDVNEAAVKFYGAKNKAELLGNLGQVMSTVDIGKFAESLVSVWQGDKTISYAARQMTLDGQEVDVVISAPLPKQDDLCQVFPLTITDISEMKKKEKQLLDLTEEKNELIYNLNKALEDLKKLEGILPICAACKKIRDDRGGWSPIEDYISQRSEARFSHGICPTCAGELYPELNEE